MNTPSYQMKNTATYSTTVEFSTSNIFWIFIVWHVLVGYILVGYILVGHIKERLFKFAFIDMHWCLEFIRHVQFTNYTDDDINW